MFDAIKKFFMERDRFAKHVGIELLSIGLGTATARLVLRDYHLNGLNTAQGGAIFTLADLVFAAAANSHGTAAVAVETHISFLKAVTAGVLTARADELSRSRRLAVYSVKVNNEQDELVAVFQGTAYIKKETLIRD